MKIYFTAAISQKPAFGKTYEEIVKTLKNLGHAVQHEQVTTPSLEDIKALTNEDHIKYYRKAVKWITQADIVIVEASFPSTLNIGHEITLALEKGKPTIVLYKKGHDSFFLSGLTSDKLFLVEYTEDALPRLVKESIEYAKDQSDTRFNFFMSPSHIAYLDWIASTKKIPRSVYLRDLIEKDREKNKDYSES